MKNRCQASWNVGIMFKNQQLSKSYLDVLLVVSVKICEIQGKL